MPSVRSKFIFRSSLRFHKRKAASFGGRHLYASGGFEEFSTDPVAEFSRPFNAGGQGGPSQVMTLSPVQQSPPPKEEAKGKSKKGGGFSLFSKDNVRR